MPKPPRFREPPMLEHLSREQLFQAVKHLVSMLNKLADSTEEQLRQLEERLSRK